MFPGLPAERLPDALPGAMLHPFGFSRDLTALTETQRQALAGAIARYRRDIAPMIPRGTVRLLTPPPLRTGERVGDDGRCFPEAEGPWVCQMETEGRAARLTLRRDGRTELELLNDIKEESTC